MLVTVDFSETTTTINIYFIFQPSFLTPFLLFLILIRTLNLLLFFFSLEPFCSYFFSSSENYYFVQTNWKTNCIKLFVPDELKNNWFKCWCIELVFVFLIIKFYYFTISVKCDTRSISISTTRTRTWRISTTAGWSTYTRTTNRVTLSTLSTTISNTSRAGQWTKPSISLSSTSGLYDYIIWILFIQIFSTSRLYFLRWLDCYCFFSWSLLDQTFCEHILHIF